MFPRSPRRVRPIQHRRVRCGAVAVGIVLGFLTGAAHGVTVRLLLVDPPPFAPGEEVNVNVILTDIGPTEAVGFQAFLGFDSDEMSFVAGSYVAAPFGLPVIPIIVADGEDIDMASGIDVAAGQTGTTANAHLATLTFEAVSQFCLPQIFFRVHVPPSRVIDDTGTLIEPLELVVISLTADCNGNEVEDACDIGTGSSRDCNFNTVPDECETLPCPADITGSLGVPDGIVGIQDFLEVLAQWGGSGCADFSGPDDVPDGMVGILDFLDLLAAWGECTL